MIPLEERFWDKVLKTDGCWQWYASRDSGGYGIIRVGGGGSPLIAAHRLSWEIHYGPIPEGVDVLHHCDDPGCTKPTHLFLGDQQANLQDCARKGRAGCKGYPR